LIANFAKLLILPISFAYGQVFPFSGVAIIADLTFRITNCCFLLRTQRQHSSQATSTLGNTPNLHIGSYTKEILYWFPNRDHYAIS